MDENLPSEQQDREGEMEQEDYDFANSQGELNTLDFIMKNMGTGKWAPNSNFSNVFFAPIICTVSFFAQILLSGTVYTWLFMLWCSYYLSAENEPQLSTDVKKELQKQLGNRLFLY